MHPLLSRPWHWLQGRRAARVQAYRSPLSIESLEDRLTLSSAPISPASEYQDWRQTRFTVNDAVQSQPAATGVGAESTTPTNSSFGNDAGLNQALADYPYRGQGYSVAVIDTGIDYNNPYLGGGWGNRVIAGWNFVAGNNNPMDDNGHGTHVAGIIGSSDPTLSGVAPDVNFIALKVLDKSGSGTFGAVDDALQWVVAHQAQYHIVAVNMSLGSGDYSSNPYTFLESDFTNLESEGVFIGVAAGNDYYGNSPGLAYPAISPNVVSVGAVWSGNFGPVSWASGARDYSSAADQIVSFSQRSSGLDLLAPGAMITSTYLNDTFKTMAGTSMATPVVTGAAVLLHEALDDAGQSGLADESHILALLQQTGANVIDASTGQDNVSHTGLTFKRIDIDAALAAVGSVHSGPSAPTLAPLGTKVMAAGSTATITLQGADPDGDALSYTASLHNATGLAYALRQQYGLTYAGSYYTNAWGENEDWLQGSGGAWFCLMPNGDLRRWAGTMTTTLQSANLIASLGASYYADPSLLWNAQPSAAPPVSVSVSGNVLSITADASFLGTFQVDVTVSDGQSTVTQTLNVSVVSPSPPQVGAMSDVSVTAGQSVTVTIPGSDPDGDPLTYTAQILGSFDSAPAILNLNGNQLTIVAAASFSGTFEVQVNVGDGTDLASTTFQVTVAAGVVAVARFPGNFDGTGVGTVEFRSDGSWWVTVPGGSPTLWAQWLPAVSWRTVMVGDFNGDGRTDIAGFSNDGTWWVGLSTGGSFTTSRWSHWLPAANWNKILTGDFNGDGKTDVAGFSNDGTWWVGQSNGFAFVTAPWTHWLSPAHWKTVSVGDFNGDGKTDIIGFNNDGTWWVGQSSGSRFVTAPWTTWLPADHWAAVFVGDFNGDGRSDVIGFNNDGSWWVGLSTGSHFTTGLWARWSPAANWATITVGDVNGDGRTDIVGQNNDGTWWVGYAGNALFTTAPWSPTGTQSASKGSPGISTASNNGAWASWLGLADALPVHKSKVRKR